MMNTYIKRLLLVNIIAKVFQATYHEKVWYIISYLHQKYFTFFLLWKNVTGGSRFFFFFCFFPGFLCTLYTRLTVTHTATITDTHNFLNRNNINLYEKEKRYGMNNLKNMLNI